jgi:hypothetical protein
MICPTYTSEAVYARYVAHRRDGLPARLALQHARCALARTPHPADALRAEGDTVTWTEDGFTLTARVVPDYDADTSYLGTFTDTWAPGAIRRPHAYQHYRGEYAYFVPARTEAEHYADLRPTHGKARARELAHRYTWEDYRRAEAYGREWGMYGVTVTARRAGITLGESSVWSIDIGDGSDTDGTLAECAHDQAEEALHEAREALTRLCAGNGEDA